MSARSTWNMKAFAILCMPIFFTACSKLFGDLRPDLDDRAKNRATDGGVWPERGILEESDLQANSLYDDPIVVGHGERDPASEYQPSERQRSWVAGTEGYRSSEAQMRESARAVQSRVSSGAQRLKSGSRTTRADFLDESQNEGSLWASTGQTNYFFTKNSVKSPGDIISVKMEDRFIKDIGSELKRTLSEDEMDHEIDFAQKMRGRKIASAEPKKEGDQANSTAAAAKEAPEEDTGTYQATAADVDLTDQLGLKAGENVMAEIVERYPSGNYKIRGTKRVNYRGSVRTMTFVGIARASDIGENDIMDSGKLYEYKLNVQH